MNGGQDTNQGPQLPRILIWLQEPSPLQEGKGDSYRECGQGGLRQQRKAAGRVGDTYFESEGGQKSGGQKVAFRK